MDGKLYAVDSVTGLKRWEFVTGDAVYSSPALGADGTVYFGSYDGNVYALNGETGEKRWEFATDGTVPASPVIGPDGTVYIGSMDNKVYAINGVTGAKRWEFLTGGGVLFTAALAADGALYVGSADGWLYVLDSQTGDKIWQLPGASTPTIGPDGTIYSAGYAMYGTSPLANTPWPKFHATLDNRGRLPGRPVVDGGNSRFTEQGFALVVHAEIGDAVRVEWSTNLVDWTTLTTVTSSTGRVDVVDPAATAQPKILSRIGGEVSLLKPVGNCRWGVGKMRWQTNFTKRDERVNRRTGGGRAARMAERHPVGHRNLRVLKSLRQQWRDLKKGRPGKSISRSIRAQQRGASDESALRRWFSRWRELFCSWREFSFCVFPGPGLPLLLVGAMLLAERSRAMARVSGLVEMNVRKINQ
jgi:outer membrane protein assembly factor BamB